MSISLEGLCKILHSDCLGPWHPKDSNLYRESESHHQNQHLEIARKIVDAIDEDY